MFKKTAAFWSRFHWQWYKSLFDNSTLNYYLTFFTVIPLLVTLFGDFPDNLNAYKKYMLAFIICSASLYIISYLIFIVFCPHFIKKYPAYKNYKEYEHSPRWIPWVTEELVHNNVNINTFINVMIEKKYIDIVTNEEGKTFTSGERTKVKTEQYQTTLVFLWRNIYYRLQMPKFVSNESHTINEEATRDIFWEIFGRYAEKDKPVRILLKIFLILSMIFFLLSIYLLLGFILFQIFQLEAFQALKCNC